MIKLLIEGIFILFAGTEQAQRFYIHNSWAERKKWRFTRSVTSKQMNEKYFFVIAITFASECEIKLQKSLLWKKNKQKSRRFFFSF